MTTATAIHDIAQAAGLNVRTVKYTEGIKGYVSHRPAYANPTDITDGYTGKYTQAIEAFTAALKGRGIEITVAGIEEDGDGEYMVIQG